MESMNTQRILLVGNQNDPLHSGYRFAIKDETGVEYPSVDHYSYVQTLLQLGLYHQVDVVMNAHPMQVSKVAVDVIGQHTPAGVTADAMMNYLRACRESFISRGLRFRLRADPMFEKCLVMTGDSLLIVCDPLDTDFAIGMDEATFKIWRQNKGIQPAQLLRYIQQPAQCPDLMIGRNKLGLLLMGLRDSVRTARARSLRLLRGDDVDGMVVSEQALCLTGIFRPLSNAYATPLFVGRKLYRSVEHYVYEKLLRKLGSPRRHIHQIRCTVDPGAVWRVACRTVKHYADNDQLAETTFNKAWKKLDKWYAAAMNAKCEQFPTIRRLLLATADALLVDVHHSFDRDWTFGSDEFELQHLLSKKYMSCAQLYHWMTGADVEYPQSLGHLGKNRTGTLLMKLRQKLFAECDPSTDESDANLCLMARPEPNWLSGQLSSHMLCFTPDSMFHPLHPTKITFEGVEYESVEHFVRSAANTYFGMKTPTGAQLAEAAAEGGNAVAVLWADHFAGYFPPVDKLFAWEYTELVEAYRRGLRACFEQQPTLLRALLDTGDSLLVCCSRYMSDTEEWSIGMREDDLRLWMDLTRVSTQALVQLCTQPLAKRPSYLGGNRLGLLLMELRREFMSKGTFAHTLPECQALPETILGSDAVTEAQHLYTLFSAVPNDTCEYDYNASVWISPLIVSAKRADDEALWTRVASRPATVLPSKDASEEGQEEEEGQPVEKEPPNPHADLDSLEDMQLRAVLMDTVLRLRHMKHANTMQEQKIAFLKSEIERVRDVRGSMSELLEKNKQQRADQSFVERSSIDTLDQTMDSQTSAAPFLIPTEQSTDVSRDEDKAAIWATDDKPFAAAQQQAPFAAPVCTSASLALFSQPPTSSSTDNPLKLFEAPIEADAGDDNQPFDQPTTAAAAAADDDPLKLFAQPMPPPDGDTPEPPVAADQMKPFDELIAGRSDEAEMAEPCDDKPDPTQQTSAAPQQLEATEPVAAEPLPADDQSS